VHFHFAINPYDVLESDQVYLVSILLSLKHDDTIYLRTEPYFLPDLLSMVTRQRGQSRLSESKSEGINDIGFLKCFTNDYGLHETRHMETIFPFCL
jgi:hypothetical protein